ncbi:MAG: hypothetical protein PHP25_02435 [Candidatus Moranbacteria bacterium]|nr:hypothetical protein [Candidatus Moranbacteria bacterium]
MNENAKHLLYKRVFFWYNLYKYYKHYTKMKKLVKKHFPNFTKRENISALSMIVIIGAVSSVLAFGGTVFARYKGLAAQKEMRHSAYEDDFRQLSGITANLQPIEDPTANWKIFESVKYGFSIKYPNGWQEPVETSAPSGSNYLSRIEFKNSSGTKGKENFDIYVYSAAKFPGPLGTDNLKKKNENVDPKECASHFDDITLGQEGYSAKEVNIKADDPCWEETFFYSLTKNGYTFNLVPSFGSSYDIKNFDEKIDLVKIFPAFYDISSTFNFEEKESVAQSSGRAVQKAASPPKPRYTAGARCPRKNDKPSYSKTKGKHMDEDCCPDPDEWPNPRCAYSGGDLGLMRSGPSAKKKG